MSEADDVVLWGVTHGHTITLMERERLFSARRTPFPACVMSEDGNVSLSGVMRGHLSTFREKLKATFARHTPFPA